ncbi:MAG: DUF4836 family protein [Prevotellaceae bacterium]|jgi:hypothetical protein|nr:DUF4836 family protein [Prevotellaceae bacterium]
MKTMKFTMIIALLYSVIICGCSKTSHHALPQLVAVPQNAAVVLSINAKQIIEKAGLNKMEQYKFHSLIIKEIENEPANEAKIMKDFLNDTRTSGLNLDNVFAYLSSNDSDIYYGITIKIDNLEKFEKFLKETGVDAEIGNKQIDLPDGHTIRWNDEILVISINAVENGIDIFNKDESKSILANELFKSEYSDKNDAYLYGEYNTLISLVEKIPDYVMDNTATLSNLVMYKDMSMSVNMNAEKGEFVVQGKMLPADKAAELSGKVYKADFNDNLYKYFPDKSLVALKFAIKPLDAYNYYKQNLGIGQTDENTETTTEKVETLDEDGNVIEEEDVVIDKYSGYTSNYNRTLKMMIEQYDEQIISVLESFTGDFIGNLSGFNEYAKPEFSLATGIVEGKENNIIELIEKAGFVKNSDDYYSQDINNMTYYVAVNKNAAYLTVTPEAIAKFLDKGYDSNISSAKGVDIKNALNSFYLNLNINDYPQMLRFFIEMSNEGRMLLPLLEKLKSINATASNTYDFEFKLKFTDNDYASKILLKGIDELISQSIDE